MPFRTGESGPVRIGAFRMLLALVIAAFLGGALGLVWQSASLFSDDEGVAVVTAATPNGE